VEQSGSSSGLNAIHCIWAAYWETDMC